MPRHKHGNGNGGGNGNGDDDFGSEYRKFLFNRFPSKYLAERIKADENRNGGGGVDGEPPSKSKFKTASKSSASSTIQQQKHSTSKSSSRSKSLPSQQNDDCGEKGGIITRSGKIIGTRRCGEVEVSDMARHSPVKNKVNNETASSAGAGNSAQRGATRGNTKNRNSNKPSASSGKTSLDKKKVGRGVSSDSASSSSFEDEVRGDDGTTSDDSNTFDATENMVETKVSANRKKQAENHLKRIL